MNTAQIDMQIAQWKTLEMQSGVETAACGKQFV